MSGRPRLEALKGTMKEDAPDIDVPAEEFFMNPTPARVQKVQKPLSIPFRTFRTPATPGIQRNRATWRRAPYER